MATFVIVHGGWGGGWEWTRVATALEAQGHLVRTPTLSGMGAPGSGATEPVGLSTHVGDVVDALLDGDLHDVVLCGASYGGMPVTGAADVEAGRLAMVVYVDALVPEDGERAIDLLPAWFREQVLIGLAEHGGNWCVPMPAGLLPTEETTAPFGLLPDELAGYLDRLGPQPAATFADPLELTGASKDVAKAFIRCTRADADPADDPIAASAARARAAGWIYRELTATHDPQLTNPSGTAQLLQALAVGAPDVPPSPASRR